MIDWEFIKNVLILIGIGVVIAGVGFLSGYFTALNENFEAQYIKLPFFESVNYTSHDRINMSNVTMFNDYTCIRGEFTTSSYKNTGSMKPSFSGGHNGLYQAVTNETELFVGDVVTFERKDIIGTSHIVHRIIKIGNDTEGWYAITKGDNNQISDGQVRKWQIQRVLVGMLY